MYRAESEQTGQQEQALGGSSPMGYGPVRWGGGWRGEEARELGLGRLRSTEAEQRLKRSWRSSVSNERKQGQRLAMQVVSGEGTGGRGRGPAGGIRQERSRAAEERGSGPDRGRGTILMGGLTN